MDKQEFISISILLFSSIGMISAARMHLYLALLFHRDYFARLNASLSDSFAPQGLFHPAECISIGLFCSTGIISTARMHLYRTLLLHRDYFTPVRCISIWLFCSTGIISPARMHPITGRPSLKTSLPGHSVKFRFLIYE